MKLELIFQLFSFFAVCNATIYLEDFDAVHNDSSLAAVLKNNNAISSALQAAANSGSNSNIVYIPPNAIYYISSVSVQDLSNIVLNISGKFIVTTSIANWPIDSNSNLLSVFHFYSCNYLRITGNGVIDGQGWIWWYRTILTKKDYRPLAIFDIRQSIGLVIDGITLINSPQYYFWIYDLMNVHIKDIIISTDPYNSLKRLTFPLNTDGIDIHATNAIIENIHITNYDDTIAVKPCHKGFKYCKCSSNISINNITTYHGVGISIGSVTPHTNHNCVNNITFNKITMIRPLKGIYIKTNPGNSGSGSISNILYSNIYMNSTLWWTIYIGPQQQLQPSGSGTGCMYYPYLSNYCTTQPLVTITNISLVNILAENPINYYNSPGVIRCNEYNPCTHIHLHNVLLPPPVILVTSANTLRYSPLEKQILGLLGPTTDEYYWEYISENVECTSSASSPVLRPFFTGDHEVDDEDDTDTEESEQTTETINPNSDNYYKYYSNKIVYTIFDIVAVVVFGVIPATIATIIIRKSCVKFEIKKRQHRNRNFHRKSKSVNNLPHQLYIHRKSNRVKFLDELNMGYKDSIVVRGGGNISSVHNDNKLSNNRKNEEGETETDMDIEENSKHNLVTI